MFRYLYLVFFIALSALNFNSAEAGLKPKAKAKIETELKSAIQDINSSVNSAGTIDYQTNCANCPRVVSAAPKTQPTTILESPENNKSIELTVLTEKNVNSIFSDLASRKDIPFGYPMDGCYARAHQMVQILEEQGIIAGKAFIEGDLFVESSEFGEVNWGYHVAPVVMVKKGNKTIPYVIDPSLFNKPVPQAEWKAKMLTKSKASMSREYYTKRFAYDPSERESDLTDYPEETVDDMVKTNQNYSDLLKRFKERLKNK
ncbi:MAG: hypothetical protein EHM20_04330 [Alphaproteobacteria bacterium]|nr:MAG: hypothetical protein EHM20_04330 [Alphaproteobacteria bacterium]